MCWRHAVRATTLLLIPVLACSKEDPLAPSLMLVNPPASLAATAIAYNVIGLAWQDNATNETGFEVHRSTAGPSGTFVLLVTTGVGATSYSDYGLSHSTQYCYKARAFRTTGRKNTYSAFSSVACATTLALPVPAVPTGANAVPQASTYLTLTWVDNATDETGFRIEFSLDAGGTWQTITSPGANATTFTHYGRTPEQAVCYRIFAVNSFGNSLPSNVDCTAPPISPLPVSATGAAGPAIDLSWTDRSAVEDGYEVRRAGPDNQWTTVVRLSAGSQSYHDVGIAAGIRYSYLVAATRDGGYSDFSSASAMSVISPPPAPTTVNVAPQGSSWIGINWAGPTDNVEDFRIERSSDGGAGWSTIGTVDWSSQWFWDGVVSEQRICYRVIAVNNVGESASSVACTTAPAAPTDLLASPADGGVIDLSWTDNADADGGEDGYEVWQLVNDCGYGYYYYCYSYYVTIATLQPNTTTFRVSGLDPQSFYTFVVIAIKGGGYSDQSNEAGSYPGPTVP